MIAAILNLISTSNFISIHSQSLYKLSMIRFVHKVHFDVAFFDNTDCTLFSRDNLKNFDTIMCLFDRFVNHVNCYFYVFFLFVLFFLLLFIMCRLAKKDLKETKTKTHK